MATHSYVLDEHTYKFVLNLQDMFGAEGAADVIKTCLVLGNILSDYVTDYGEKNSFITVIDPKNGEYVKIVVRERKS